MANRTLSARKKIGTIYDTNDTKTIHGQLLSGEKKTKNKIRKFHSQTVIFLGVNDSDTYFITSDNPVIEPVSKKESFFVKLNNFEIEANFILPINSKYALIFVNRESAIKYFNTFPNESSPIIKTSVNNPILFYNQALFKTANQYLFAERKKELEMLM